MSKISELYSALRFEGIKSAAWRVLRYGADRFNPFRASPAASVFANDVLSVDWTVSRDFNSGKIPKPQGGYNIAWLISPPGRTSGGHQNAFRFMDFLEKKGHKLTIYFYSTSKYPAVSIKEIQNMFSQSNAYPNLKAQYKIYSPDTGISGEIDAIFSSDWQTAYAAFRYEGNAKRFYFAQDFEPAFYPWGSDYVLAENTYKFGFHGFTAGQWLSKKLTNDYHMSSDFYDYAVDKSHYRLTNFEPRNEVLFYARPPTPRRATEFGLLVLAELKKIRPDITVNIVGWDMSGFDVPFDYVNHKALDISELNEIYNKCAAGLVLSLTNMSLLPMEIMSCGVVPVVNDAPNTREVLHNPHIEFVPMSPPALVQKIISIVDRKDAVDYAKVIAKSVIDTNWSDPGEQFIEKFDLAMKYPIIPQRPKGTS